MNKEFYATEISVSHDEQTLTINWADGHRSVYSLDGIRRACPCVECAGGHDNMGRPADPAIFNESPRQKWTITQMQESGNYAMQIFWGDGHDSGIYRWEYLRQLCPIENKQSPAAG